MAIKIRIPSKTSSKSSPKNGKKRRSDFHLGDPMVKIAVALFLVLSLAFFGVFVFYYVRYDKIIDRKMNGQIFNNSAKIYARPEVVRDGESYTVDDLVARLKRAGYTEEGHKPESPWGRYRLEGDGIEIMPGPQSFHSPDGALIRFRSGQIASITSAGDKGGSELDGYELEPQLVTALFEGEQRTKRQLVSFNELPKVMVNAVVAIEDRRFFQHSGVNFYRLIEAAIVDLREHGRQQGGSTLTMQISRGFFLTPEKKIKRKLIEILIAIELEQKFNKDQIFELYANQVYMGQRGSYSINGFGEAARAYFNKDVRNLSLPEAATLAGIIQSPNYYNPYKRPDRVTERRNTVLESMVETGAITRAQCDEAKATPLKLAAPNVEASDAPYFVDLVKDQLQNKFPENELNDEGLRIYTTIDPQLQHAAAEAVQIGIKIVDDQVIKQRTHRKKIGTGKNTKYETVVEGLDKPMPQIALIAMDPHTGEVLAMVGGRNYAFSQLNHAIAKRPTGSIFKPFVYAAALNTAVNDTPPDQVITASSTVDDAPSTFTYGDQIYEPRNYMNEYKGTVSLRYALMESLNNATVKVAETVGYDKVADLARAAGITSVKPTPAMALGAYDATPLEMAAAYTVFSNGGTRLDPLLVHSVRAANGDVVQDFQTDTRQVLDPRIAYVMTSMMEGVINNGTGSTVRQRGFTTPAAGKTGTSHDGWFAGYTSNLLCIVWVGYDDYSDLRLAGGATAAPIWAEFMKRAVALPQYHDVKDFSQPSGVVDVAIDKVTNRLSTAACPEHYEVAFVSGTEPQLTCEQTDNRNVLQKILGLGQPTAPPVITGGQPRVVPPNGGQPAQPGVQQAQQQQPAQPEEKKKGFFGKLKDIFGGGGDDKKNQQNPPPRGNGNKPPQK